MSKQLKGSLMVLTAGIAWGFSGVSGQYLMAHGVNVNLLTSLRLLLSGILLTASVFFRQRDKLVQALKDRKTLVSIALFALFGLVLNQYAYLSAIQYTNAGTATMNGLDYSLKVIKKHPEWVKQAHDLGLKVNVWTVNKEEEIGRASCRERVSVQV